MTVHLFGYPTNLGLPVAVQQHAPAALRALGAVDQLRSRCQLVDWGDFALPPGDTLSPGADLTRRVVSEGRRQAEFMTQRYRPGDLWVTLGGDHSASLGAVLALAAAAPPFDILWVDAHGDFNTPATSPSGNPHGMVLALLAGLTPFLEPIIDPKRIHILGARDLDPGEAKLLQQQGVRVWSPADLRRDAAAVLDAVGPRVYLSFDLDVLDPAAAPAVRTPVAGGLSVPEAAALVSAVADQRDLLAVDLVEYASDLDSDGRSGRAALTVLAACVRCPVATAGEGRNCAPRSE